MGIDITGRGISDLRGTERPDYMDLMWGYKDKATWFIRDKILVPHPLMTTIGQYRKDKDETWFKVPDTTVPENGIPNTISFEDESVDIDLSPLAQNVTLSELELRQYWTKMYASRQDMIQGNIRRMGRALKIKQEETAYNFIADTNNYEASQVKTMAASGDPEDVYFDDYSNSDPVQTVFEMREENKYINTIAVNYRLFLILQNHPRVLDKSVVSAVDRLSADPWVYVETLKRVFGVENFLVGMTESLSASSTPGSSSRSSIWGDDVMWLGHVNPMAGKDPDVPTWAKEYYLGINGSQDYGGFMVMEHYDARKGGFGVLYEDAWKWKQDKLYAKRMGSLIVNPLTP